MRTLRSRMVSPLLAVPLALLAPAARASSPVATLVKDINTAGSPASSSPREITRVGAVVYFTADDGTGFCQLWRTDGTASGTRSVKRFDSMCGPFDTYAKGPVRLTDLNGTLVFFVDDGWNGLELWRSDGTEAGTFLVKDINPGAASGIPLIDGRYETAVLNGTLYFAADDGVHGAELWRSDGTETGTAMVKDIYPGLTWSRPSWLTALGGLLYFSADDGTHGAEPWKSDGTEAGTVLVKDVNPGIGYAFPQYFAASNGGVFFIADDGSSGDELWRTDGTDAGTYRVKDIAAGAWSSIIRNFSVHSPLTDVNGVLFFPAWSTIDVNGTAEMALWRSDGTEAGTFMLKKMPCCGEQLDSLTDLGGTLLFAHSKDLWRSDGTEAGTVVVGGVSVPLLFSWWLGPDQAFTLAGGIAYFPGETIDGASGLELWRTDGTAAGTWMVKDINTLAFGWGSNPGMIPDSMVGGFLHFMVDVGGTLYFPAEDARTGSELWRSDGSASGTVRVADVNPGIGTSRPTDLVDLDGRLVFSADDGIHGREPWASDGTTAGTVLLLDVAPGPDASMLGGFTELNGRLFFLAQSSSTACGLWRTDGTPRGTVPVKRFDTGLPNTGVSWLTRVGRKLFFRLDDGGAGTSSLWTSDGTAAGTVPLNRHDVGPSYAYLLTESGGRLYFLAYDGPASGWTDIGLWKSDGTAKGTVLVKKFSTASTIAIPFSLVGLDGDVLFDLEYFDGRPQASELWRSDGTPAGTALVKAIAFPAGPQFTVVDGTLYFSADDGVSGTELWKTDGTAAGTRMVKDLFPGGTSYGDNGEWWVANSSSPTALTSMGGKLYFHASDEAGGGLWRSDGTARGTVKVRSLVSGPDFASPKPFTAIGRTLYFSEDDGLTGREPWRSDGTARGTVRLADVAPGAGSSNPSGFAISGANLFFAADGPTTGRELWAIPLSQR